MKEKWDYGSFYINFSVFLLPYIIYIYQNYIVRSPVRVSSLIGLLYDEIGFIHRWVVVPVERFCDHSIMTSNVRIDQSILKKKVRESQALKYRLLCVWDTQNIHQICTYWISVMASPFNKHRPTLIRFCCCCCLEFVLISIASSNTMFIYSSNPIITPSIWTCTSS